MEEKMKKRNEKYKVESTRLKRQLNKVNKENDEL